MKAIEVRAAREIDKSFVLFRETGKFFPVPWHYHPEYELVLVTKSTGRRMVGDHIGYFDEGDLVFMGPLLPHVWVNDEPFINGSAGYDADALVIQFLENFMGDTFLQLPETKDFTDFLQRSKQGIVIKGNTKKQITNLMVKMPAMNGMKRLSSLLTIFDLLATSNEYELLASPGFVQDISLTCSDRYSKISEYILRNFKREISLPEIAGVANMAVTTFCNFFKANYRVTFVEYLTNIRIGLACKLLADNKNNIIEVAYEVGFNNLGNFNRQFKRIKKMTPREYRKKLTIDFTPDDAFLHEKYLIKND